MTMKEILFVLVPLFCAATVFSQDMESLRSRAETMYAASYNLDLDAVVEATYPKLFELTNKETMKQTMARVFNNETMVITFNNPKTEFKYSAIKTIDNRKFALVEYLNSMNMNLTSAVDAELAQTMADGLKRSGNYTTVIYDEKSNKILAEGPAIMIAIADDLTNNQWMFINYDPKVFVRLFPESLKKELGL